MPVPSTIADLSATASSNYPQGSESPSTLDDYIRAQGAIIRQVSDAKAAAGANNDITSLSGITGQIGTNSEPMTFYTGGSERMRIDVSGNLGLGVTPRTTTVSYKAFEFGQSGYLSAVAGGAGLNLTSNGYIAAGAVWTYPTNGPASMYSQAGGAHYWSTAPSGTAGNAISFTQAMTLDASSNLLLTGGGGLGYGTGSGGTVTQATSKFTAVTLNKPTGQITMNNAALAAGATVFFTLSNSLVSDTDVVIPMINFSNGDKYSVRIWDVSAGAVQFLVKNESAIPLSEAVIINFAIIKGAVA